MGAYSLTRKAAADIDGIYTYTIEQHGLALARKYVNGLRRLLRASRRVSDARPSGRATVTPLRMACVRKARSPSSAPMGERAPTIRRIPRLLALSLGARDRSGFNVSIIRNYRLALPERDEQDRLVDGIENTTKGHGTAIAVAKRSIAYLAEYRTRLVADVVTGRVDVRAVAIDEFVERFPDVDGQQARTALEHEAKPCEGRWSVEAAAWSRYASFRSMTSCQS